MKENKVVTAAAVYPKCGISRRFRMTFNTAETMFSFMTIMVFDVSSQALFVYWARPNTAYDIQVIMNTVPEAQ